MRTTIRFDDHLLEEAKRLAARTGRTLSKVVEDAVREVVARGNAQHIPNRQHFRLRTFRGSGARPGVDLDDSAALLGLMERNDPY